MTRHFQDGTISAKGATDKHGNLMKKTPSGSVEEGGALYRQLEISNNGKRNRKGFADMHCLGSTEHDITMQFAWNENANMLVLVAGCDIHRARRRVGSWGGGLLTCFSVCTNLNTVKGVTQTCTYLETKTEVADKLLAFMKAGLGCPDHIWLHESAETFFWSAALVSRWREWSFFFFGRGANFKGLLNVGHRQRTMGEKNNCNLLQSTGLIFQYLRAFCESKHPSTQLCLSRLTLGRGAG